MNITISQEDYENYLKKKKVVSNDRLRADDETFFDALLSVDMTADPECRKALETIGALS